MKTAHKSKYASWKSAVKELSTIFLPVCITFLVIGVFCRDEAQAMVAFVLSTAFLILKDNL